ncbi:MAG: hypothetical protein AAGI71_01770 [Bacteroidota bacterium]
MSDYIPIACSFYDELELRAMRGRQVKVTYLTADGLSTTRVARILDVFARGQEEFIRLEPDEEIRLDRLMSIDGLARPGAGC